MNIAPLLAEVFHELPLRSEVSQRLRAQTRPDDLDAALSQDWLRILATPLTPGQVGRGEVGLVRVDAEAWARVVGEAEQATGAPSSPYWMEAAPLEGDQFLIYPNDAGAEAAITAYAPIRMSTALGEPATLLRRMHVVPGGTWEKQRVRLQTDLCTVLIEGELGEREVVCVETGCGHDCGRTFFRDGVEILECGC